MFPSHAPAWRNPRVQCACRWHCGGTEASGTQTSPAAPSPPPSPPTPPPPLPLSLSLPPLLVPAPAPTLPPPRPRARYFGGTCRRSPASRRTCEGRDQARSGEIVRAPTRSHEIRASSGELRRDRPSACRKSWPWKWPVPTTLPTAPAYSPACAGAHRPNTCAPRVGRARSAGPRVQWRAGRPRRKTPRAAPSPRRPARSAPAAPPLQRGCARRPEARRRARRARGCTGPSGRRRASTARSCCSAPAAAEKPPGVHGEVTARPRRGQTRSAVGCRAPPCCRGADCIRAA